MRWIMAEEVCLNKIRGGRPPLIQDHYNRVVAISSLPLLSWQVLPSSQVPLSWQVLPSSRALLSLQVPLPSSQVPPS
jgi:hypothetical protein